jgi:small-conductance mechanosensitive channel
MFRFSLPETATIVATLAWPVIAFFAALFGFIGLRRRARQRKAWRVAMVSIAAVPAVECHRRLADHQGDHPRASRALANRTLLMGS